jgi:hypothetical protein
MSDIDKDKNKPTTEESAEILELEELIRAKDEAKAEDAKENDRS